MSTPPSVGQASMLSARKSMQYWNFKNISITFLVVTLLFSLLEY